MISSLLIGLAGLVAASTKTTNGGGNTLPTHKPVTQFPVSTQTHFDSPACTKGASTLQNFRVNYNFESVERTDPINALTPIGVYNLLNFVGINHVNTDPDFDGNHLGLAPYTYPNAAAFNLGSEIQNDPLKPSGSTITASYIESTVDTFTPEGFAYGCVLPSPYTAGSFPSTCTITATGFNKAGARVASQEFHFVKNGSVIQDQNIGVFKSGFANIHSLNLGVSSPLKNAALIDNFVATLHQQSCAPLYKGSYNNGSPAIGG